MHISLLANDFSRCLGRCLALGILACTVTLSGCARTVLEVPPPDVSLEDLSNWESSAPILSAPILSASVPVKEADIVKPPPQVHLTAPDWVSLDETMQLQIAVSLHSHSKAELEVTAGTPCSVFRWAVVASGTQLSGTQAVVQTKPNYSCRQVVAYDVLFPGGQLTQTHEIKLDAVRYTAGQRYQLQYQFWGFGGIHDFVVRAGGG